MSEEPPVIQRSTRRNPGEALSLVDNPERIIFPSRGHRPVLTRPTPVHGDNYTPVRPVSAPPGNLEPNSLLSREWDLFVNPPNPHGYPVIKANWPPAPPSVSLDQLSDASQEFTHLSVPRVLNRQPRISLPGAFDPNTSLVSTGNDTVRMHQQQSTSAPEVQASTSVPGYEMSEELARVKSANDQLRDDNDGLRAEMREIRLLLTGLLKQDRPAVPDVVEEAVLPEVSASTQRPGAGHAIPSESSHHTPQLFTSTPAVGNRQHLFNIPASLPSVAETPSIPAQPTFDFTKFRATDWPQYKGKFGDIPAFRTWRYQMEITFRVKSIDRADDRFRILPLVLPTDPAASWCRRSERNFIGRTWDEVMMEMQGVVLPVGWDDAAKERLRELTMKPNESSTAYCARARLIQEEIGFEECCDKDLALAVVGGTIGTFKAWVKMERIVQNSLDPVTKRFSFPIFEERMGAIWLLTQEIDNRNLAKGKSITTQATVNTAVPSTQRSNLERGPGASSSARPALSAEETLARNIRFGAYMRSMGLCPRCKTPCDKWLGGCDAKPNSAFFSVPMDFPRAPPYPPAKSQVGATSTRPPAPAGPRVAPKRVDVASIDPVRNQGVDVAAVGEFPDLGRADLAAYEQMVDQLNNRTVEDDLMETAENEPDFEPIG